MDILGKYSNDHIQPILFRIGFLMHTTNQDYDYVIPKCYFPILLLDNMA